MICIKTKIQMLRAESMDNDLSDLRCLKTPSTGSDRLDPYISPTEKISFKRVQIFKVSDDIMFLT